MSSDFNSNPNRVDVITNVVDAESNASDLKNPEVLHNWIDVVQAILGGERIIRTSMKNTTENTYDASGSCLTVGCYENEFCQLLREVGITDIRYGSPSHHLQTTNDTYTIYKPAVDRDKQIEALIEKINAEAEYWAEYSTENIDSSYAEFCESFDYGEGDIDDIVNSVFDVMSENDYDYSKDHIKQYIEAQGLNSLQLYCTLETAGIRITSDEIFSTTLGELEYQLSDETLNIIEDLDLTDDERDEIKRSLDFYWDNGDYLYIDCNYDRWVMVLDPDGFSEALSEFEPRKIYPPLRPVK